MQEQKTSQSAMGHLRANLWLLVLSLVIGCVLYPAAVWAFGWLFFHNAAEGCLIDKDGKPTDDPSKAVGSRQIAQQFNSSWFFQPRPSAASYNGAASSGSNFAASNPKLRGRVATLLGAIARYSDAYKKAHPIPSTDPMQPPSDPNPQDDIKAWFHQQTDPIQDYVLQWAKDHPDMVAAWKKDHPDSPRTLGADDPAKALTADDLGVYFINSYQEEEKKDREKHPDKDQSPTWPAVEAADDVQARIVVWAKDHPDVVKKWQAANPKAKEGPKDEELVAFFYQDYAKNPKDWPALDSGEWADEDKNGVVTALVKPVPMDKVSFGPFDDWTSNNPTIAQTWATGGWVTGGAWTKDYILQWAGDHPDVVAAWKSDNPKSPKTLGAADSTMALGADDLVSYFFKSYEKEHPGKWPTQEALADVIAKHKSWVKDHAALIQRWKDASTDLVANWKKQNKGEPTADDLMDFAPQDYVAFFCQEYAKDPKEWPPLGPGEWVDTAQKAVVKPDAQDSDVEGTFFDAWYTAKKFDAVKDFVQVPADLVTTSGSGLDPDITRANADYQKETVIPAYADKLATDFLGGDAYKGLTDEQKKKLHDDWTAQLTKQIGPILEGLLNELQSPPMFGLTGDKPLINVLQLNLRLQAEMAKIPMPPK